MEKPEHHILVCASFRTTGDPKGVCHKKNAGNLLQYLQAELGDRGLDNVLVSSTGCLRMCVNGPVMAVYPEGYWCGEVDEEKIDAVLDAIQENRVPEELLLT
jgi:(2Fe-2S) ferredoxin